MGFREGGPLSGAKREAAPRLGAGGGSLSLCQRLASLWPRHLLRFESPHVPIQAQRCWRGQSYTEQRRGSDYGLMVAGFEPGLPQCGYAYLTTLPTIKAGRSITQLLEPPSRGTP